MHDTSLTPAPLRRHSITCAQQRPSSKERTQLYAAVHAEENVVTFDVAVNDGVGMQKFECLQALQSTGR